MPYLPYWSAIPNDPSINGLFQVIHSCGLSNILQYVVWVYSFEGLRASRPGMTRLNNANSGSSIWSNNFVISIFRSHIMHGMILPLRPISLGPLQTEFRSLLNQAE